MKRLVSVLSVLALLATGALAFPANAKSAVNLNISANNISHEVSQTLYGAFIEDISKACDGGLTANLVYNNSFEYNDLPEGNTTEDGVVLNETAWQFSNVNHSVESENPMNKNNLNYELLTVSGKGIITNLGCTEDWDYKTWTPNPDKQSSADMGFKEGEAYAFSCYVSNVDFEGALYVGLASKANENNLTELDISKAGAGWIKLSAELVSNATEDGGLSIILQGEGSLCLDFVSLVPVTSYGYGNPEWQFAQLRSDLAQTLIDLNPAFIRFPGGCFCEGDSLERLYDWKATIGPVEERVQTYNVWRNDVAKDYYINSNQVGYGEYFNLCDDIGAEPLPCLNVGLTCQGRNNYDFNVDAHEKLSMTDEEFRQYLIDVRGYWPDDDGGIEWRTNEVNNLGYQSEADWTAYLESIALTPGTPEWDNYVQDILDLIEFANGDKTTTYWGALRAAYGHEEPYNLKYIELGNENWGEVYWRNFDALYKAVKEKYPDIQIITTAGTWLEGDAFDYAWETANEKYPDCFVDEHYYTGQSYLYDHNDRYDNYTRDGAKVFVGEYAATADGYGTMQTKSNITEAVEEATFMTGFERNGDVVAMTCIAPTFAKVNAQNWTINEIWFDSQSVALSPAYYTQMLFANNLGMEYINAEFDGEVSLRELAQSVTVDQREQAIYVKLVNSSGKPQTVNLNFSGFDGINAASIQHLSAKFPSACNEVGKSVYIAPVEETLGISGETVSVEAERYSVNVIRIAYGDNSGDGFYHLPDNTPVAKFYIPLVFRIAIPSICGVVILVIAAAVIITKAIKKRRNRKPENGEE